MGLPSSQLDTAAPEHHCTLGSSSGGNSALLELSKLGKLPMSSIGSDYTVTMRPRVRVWCARTGEFLYEPTHSRLEEVLICVLKKVDLDQWRSRFARRTELVYLRPSKA